MPYTPTTWVDGVTPVNATNLNKLENGLAAAVGIPADVVVASGGNHLIRNKFLVGDTQPAFYLRSDGYHGFGPGGSGALDTQLYRSGAAQLQTESSFFLRGGVGTYFALFANLTDAYSRLYIDSNGNMNWSAGTTPADVQLTRLGVGMLYSPTTLGSGQDIIANRLTSTQVWLNTDGSIYFGAASDVKIARTAAGELTVNGALKVSGDFDPAVGRLGQVCKTPAGNDWNNALDNGWYMLATGTNAPAALTGWVQGTVVAHGAAGYRIQRVWDFTAATDSQVYERRQQAGVWGAWYKSGLYSGGVGSVRTDLVLVSADSIFSQPTGTGGGFSYNPSVAGGWAFNSTVQGEASQRFIVTSAGTLSWGTGAVAPDTNLYRSGVGALKTDGSLEVGSTVYSHASTSGAVAFIAQDLHSAGWLLMGKLAADSVYRVYVDPNGKVSWGPGGSTATDTTLYRGAVGVVKTDGSVAHMGRGTSLPASPIDGQEYILVDSLTLPTYAWKFRYDSGISDAYKWVFVGGASVTAVQNTSGSVTSNAAYIDPSNLCSLTVARAGIYDITFGLMQANNTAGDLMNWAVKVGSGTPVDSESIYFRAAGTGVSTPGSRSIRKTAAASDLLKMQCKPAGNGSGNNQWMNVIPLRVS